MLDSNAIIALITYADEGMVSRAAKCNEEDIVTSAIAYAEVALGSASSRPPAPRLLEAFVDEVPVLPFDLAAAATYAILPFRRGSYDRLIAAHALSTGLIVVTRNTQDFVDVPGLRVENWMTGAAA